MRRSPKNSNFTGNRVRIDSSAPEPETIRRAVDLLERQGVVVFPTTGLYGLGADALDPRAVGRVFAIKRRPTHKPLLVLLSTVADLPAVVRRVPDFARPLLGLWPGGITLIFEAADALPPELTGGTGTIGVRLPRHPVARALVQRLGRPITGTSANLADRPAPASIEQLDPQVSGQVDLVLDAGRLAGGPGSTILDATAWPVRVIREGAVPGQAIDAILVA